MVTSRRHGMRACMRTTATADGTLLTREVRFWMDTGAYADNGPRVTATAADAAPGPYRFEAVERGRPTACTATRPRPGPTARSARPTSSGSASPSSRRSRAARASTRSSCAGAHSSVPGEPVRPDGSGKPLDADLVGDVERAAEAVGWDEPRRPWVGRGVSVGLLAAGAHPVSRASVRLCSDGIGRRLRRHDGDGPGPAHSDGPDRRRGARALERARARARRRHALHALRPLDGREPLDDRRRPGGQARRRGRRAAPARDRRRAVGRRPRARRAVGRLRAIRRRGGRLPGADRPALRVSRRGDHRGGRGPPDRRRHRLLRRGASLLGGVRRRRRNRGRPRNRRDQRAADGDRRRRRPGDQPAARRAPGRGRDAAGHRQRAVRGDAARRRRDR